MTTLSRHRGFSLIEVLIGVLSLSMGLLGLGAIIPVVVRQQRAASDATLGIAAARDAAKFLVTRPDLDPAAQTDTGWDIWLGNTNWSPRTGARAYLFENWRTNVSPVEMDPLTGDFNLYGSLGGSPFQATLKLADRLWPSPSRQTAQILRPDTDPFRPQFVWDFVARRVQTPIASVNDPEPQKLQIAIFVRRIDLNIRVPRGTHGSPAQPITLLDVLEGATYLPSSADRRVPVGVNAAGIPQNNGTGVYARPVMVDADFNANARDIIEFPSLTTADDEWALLSRPGQKLVDNLGNVYTVQGLPDETTPIPPSISTAVVVTPQIPAWVRDQASVGANSPGALRQVVFTPQIPAAVSVFTITRSVP